LVVAPWRVLALAVVDVQSTFAPETAKDTMAVALAPLG